MVTRVNAKMSECAADTGKIQRFPQRNLGPKDPCPHGAGFAGVNQTSPAVPITKGNFQAFLWFSTDYKILL